MKHLGPVRSPWPGQGYSLIELMFVLGLAAILSGIALPRLLGGLDELRARGAARYLSTRLQQTRMEAVRRSVNAAVRFTAVDSSFSYAAYLDGNHNGVRSLDIQRGLDRRLDAEERLRDQFPGIDFGTLPDLPAVDRSTPPPGTDPVRLGSSNMVAFTAQGTATPGSLYIRGKGNTQFVVRIFGETGKTSILRFDRRSGTWKPL
jgi:prepilin-type N-terminal cleavage/methylation domain-containing protein